MQIYLILKRLISLDFVIMLYFTYIILIIGHLTQENHASTLVVNTDLLNIEKPHFS